MNGDKHDSDKEPSSPTEEDLENFMTLDSVGDVDGKFLALYLETSL